jgi:hypothetical protein
VAAREAMIPGVDVTVDGGLVLVATVDSDWIVVEVILVDCRLMKKNGQEHCAMTSLR